MEMCKTLLGFAHFHRHGWHELKTTKPDRSFATNTGHFHLLLTADKQECSKIGTPTPAFNVESDRKALTAFLACML
jgi:hypothetical protein